jgi:hypothetical protein
MPSEEATPAPVESRIEWVHCNDCGRDTRNVVLFEHIQRGSQTVDEERGFEVSWRTRWTMFECLGCEAVRLRRAYWFSEDFNEERMEFFPPPVSRDMPDWSGRLGAEERDLLKEVYVALHADSRRLAMMGVRTLVDIVMNREGDLGSFGAGLNALVTRGLIGTRQRDVLRAALDVGDAAAHRGHRPSRDDVNTVIDIVEHLLMAELLGPAADELRTRTPARPARVRIQPGQPGIGAAENE